MFIDANELAEDQRIEADVCVIGGGVAGISLARELAHTHLRVMVIESGAFQLDATTQELYQGEYLAHDLFDLYSSRLRFFGGSSNHWAGNCQVFPAEELKERSWMPDSGWPIGAADLAPYYQRAGVVCELPAVRFDAAYWAARLNFPLPSLEQSRFLHEVLVKSPPTRFGTRYRTELAKAQGITVYLNSNVTGFSLPACGSRVTAVTARTLGGRRLQLHARTFILACGGIENARLLLNADSDCPEGIGNGNGLVGRYYMDHPVVWAGTLVAPRGSTDTEFFKLHGDKNTARVSGILRVSAASQRSQQMASACIVTKPQTSRTWARSSLSTIWQAAKQRRIHGLLWHQLGEALDDLADTVRDRGQQLDPGYETHIVGVRCEQAPNPDSRVTLTDERDDLGQRRVHVDWRLSAFDRHTMEQALQLFAGEMGRLGLGRVHNDLGDDPVWPDKMRGGPHHMGTTRMHDDPKRGVVDRNCRVHAMDNLYIAGSSVFPTSSSSMPTLTIVALALRLADHIKQEAQQWQ